MNVDGEDVDVPDFLVEVEDVVEGEWEVAALSIGEVEVDVPHVMVDPDHDRVAMGTDHVDVL